MENPEYIVRSKRGHVFLKSITTPYVLHPEVIPDLLRKVDLEDFYMHVRDHIFKITSVTFLVT